MCGSWEVDLQVFLRHWSAILADQRNGNHTMSFTLAVGTIFAPKEIEGPLS